MEKEQKNTERDKHILCPAYGPLLLAPPSEGQDDA